MIDKKSIVAVLPGNGWAVDDIDKEEIDREVIAWLVVVDDCEFGGPYLVPLTEASYDYSKGPYDNPRKHVLGADLLAALGKTDRSAKAIGSASVRALLDWRINGDKPEDALKHPHSILGKRFIQGYREGGVDPRKELGDLIAALRDEFPV